jgi:hypothetical protein
MWAAVSGIEVFSERNCLDCSYVPKNRADPGAEPIAAAFKPLYIPRNPPDLKNPLEDCL